MKFIVLVEKWKGSVTVFKWFWTAAAIQSLEIPRIGITDKSIFSQNSLSQNSLNAPTTPSEWVQVELMFLDWWSRVQIVSHACN